VSKPFKITTPAPLNQNAEPQRQIADLNPAKDDRHLNEECINDVPDHPPRIPWPKAEPLEQSGKPFKVNK